MKTKDGQVDYTDTLLALAQAVVDLADGMGGDVQERHRAHTIAQALQVIADGGHVWPIPRHEDARLAWEKYGLLGDGVR